VCTAWLLGSPIWIVIVHNCTVPGARGTRSSIKHRVTIASTRMHLSTSQGRSFLQRMVNANVMQAHPAVCHLFHVACTSMQTTAAQTEHIRFSSAGIGLISEPQCLACTQQSIVTCAATHGMSSCLDACCIFKYAGLQETTEALHDPCKYNCGGYERRCHVSEQHMPVPAVPFEDARTVGS
jgi:hypothetical protein